ncbi:MAG: cation-translocating P-type ATPase [Gammaproteobacteria bacterium]|nr:cation-translocating P-type ATPase [Gammaproteobacteria bacterium]
MPEPIASGLSETEAAARLRRHGPNELPQNAPRSFWRIAAGVLAEPMLLLLLGCGAVYLLLGDLREALVLLGFDVVVVGITLYQEHRTERVLETLRDLSSPRALVIRDGRRRRIPGREVVAGDWIVLSEGDRVPADGELLESSHLRVDESLLTGESLPAAKRLAACLRVDTHRQAAPGSPADRHVYAGTLVTGGRGVARVAATGADTELGRIGAAVGTLKQGDSPLQQQTRRLVWRIALLAVLVCIAVALAYGLMRGRWLESALAGISLAMALLPEEVPVILTVFLALGAWRLSRRGVLTRRMAAVEALGAATVLCVDKTGTLTENRMSVRALLPAGGGQVPVTGGPLPEAAHQLVEFAILATRQDSFDPMERAIAELGLGELVDASHLHAGWDLVHEYPLQADLLAMSQVWEDRLAGTRCIAAKGAPETIADLCHLPAPARAAVLDRVRDLSDRGWRVLAVARAQLTHDARDLTRPDERLPPDQHDLAFEYLGLLALADPLRRSVPAAVAACRRAGIRILMITGDHAGTARSIARAAGLNAADACLLGGELENLGEAALARRLATVGVVARARPGDKLRIVRALQAAGEVVAMTGDGVNDAPALRAADIGVAMGGRGTDVAREAAGLVVLDDDFSSIVDGVRQGRRIFDNLARAVAYIVAVHLPMAGLALLPLLPGWPLLLLPAHIAFLQLIIDPACSIVFEAAPATAATMQRPPRRPDAPLLGRPALAASLLQGLAALAMAAVLLWTARVAGAGDDVQRAAAFVALVAGNLALIAGHHPAGLRAPWRSDHRALGAVLLTVPAALLLVMQVPLLRELFRLGVLPPRLWAAEAATAALVLAVTVAGRRLISPAS